jgi:hypothetical protein
LSSAFARPRRPTMIEVPSEFLNVLFMTLIVFAGVNRSRQRSPIVEDVGAVIDRTP